VYYIALSVNADKGLHRLIALQAAPRHFAAAICPAGGCLSLRDGCWQHRFARCGCLKTKRHLNAPSNKAAAAEGSLPIAVP